MLKLEQAATMLKNGRIVGIPTETVYGLAANALNAVAVAKIFAAKGRPHFNPLIVHIGNPNQITEFAHNVPAKAKQLANAFWPGPLTLVLNKKDIVPAITTGGHQTVALRMPNHPTTLALLDMLSFPLAAPSANPSGYVSPTNAKQVQQMLGQHIAGVVDGGPCAIGLESTIIGFNGDTPVLLRPGGLELERIEQVVGQVLTTPLPNGSKPQAPGQLSSHYAPNKDMVFGLIDMLIEARKLDPATTGALVFQKPNMALPIENQVVLSPNGNMTEAAAHLFTALRRLEQLDHCKLVIAEPAPNHGLGLAINDRLRRAAAPKTNTLQTDSWQ